MKYIWKATFLCKRYAKKILFSLISKAPLIDNVVFECESDMQDNPRAFYEYLIKKEYNLKHKIIWLVNDVDKCSNMHHLKNVVFLNRNESNGLNAFLLHYYLSTSKFFFFSHPYWFKDWRQGQSVINTTHSVSQLKKAERKNINNKICDFVLCCNEYCKSIKEQSFGSNVIYLAFGLPRLDYLFRHKDCGSLSEKITSDKFVIVSMETFKQSRYWNDSETIDKYSMNVISNEDDMNYLDNLLGSIGAIMIIKIHHLQDMSYITASEFSNIIYITDKDLIEKDIQVNELLENADLLLTDYSSVFYDYLLLDRPIGFMIGDFDSYKRGFLSSNPFEEMPGAFITCKEELYRFIVDSVNGEDEFKTNRMVIRNKVFNYCDDNNCQRLYKWLESESKQR